MDKLDTLKNWISESNNIVFFGGAGVSTESGIPDFRSENGLYHLNYKYSPEEIVSHHFFKQYPKQFYEFYKKYFNTLNISPNICHYYLTELEKQNKLKAIVTQNIDGLHSIAGSKHVLEIHGSIYKNHCTKCHKSYRAETIFNSKDIPFCKCGAIIKPDVVLYEEPLNEGIVQKAITVISNCELLIIAGTSLKVYPASYFIHFFKGKHMVIINQETTSFDRKADLVIHKSLGDVFSYIQKE